MKRASKSNRLAGSVFAFVVALACLVWYMLACLDSPMSFSNDGQYLAFWTGVHEHLALCVHHIPTRKTRILRTYKVEDEAILTFSGPCFSPDNQWIAYSLVAPLDGEDREIDKSVTTTAPYAEMPVGKIVCGDTKDKPSGQPVKFSVVLVRRDGSGEKQLFSDVRPVLFENEQAFIMYSHTLWSPDGRYIYAHGPASWVRVDVRTGEASTIGITTGDADLSRDGKQFAVTISEGYLCVWSTEEDTWQYYYPNGFLASEHSQSWIDFSPDGERMAGPCSDGDKTQVRIIDLRTKKDTTIELLPGVDPSERDDYIAGCVQWIGPKTLRAFVWADKKPASVVEFDDGGKNIKTVTTFPAKTAASIVSYSKDLWAVRRTSASKDDDTEFVEIHNGGQVYTIDVLPLLKKKFPHLFVTSKPVTQPATKAVAQPVTKPVEALAK